jgi:hypothetical protein
MAKENMAFVKESGPVPDTGMKRGEYVDFGKWLWDRFASGSFSDYEVHVLHDGKTEDGRVHLSVFINEKKKE